jgi:hypothetical protein
MLHELNEKYFFTSSTQLNIKQSFLFTILAKCFGFFYWGHPQANHYKNINI